MKRYLRIVLILVAVGLVCFVAKRAFIFPHIHPHRGDGQFQDISRRLGPIAISGYGIRMDEFDMSERFDAEYRFGSMTNIERAAYLYLGVHDEFGPAADCFKGDQNTTLCLELADSKGVTLLKAEGPLADFICASSLNWSRYYQLNHVRFAPDEDVEYVVRISYSPGNTSKGFRGYVYVECGGHI